MLCQHAGVRALPRESCLSGRQCNAASCSDPCLLVPAFFIGRHDGGSSRLRQTARGQRVVLARAQGRRRKNDYDYVELDRGFSLNVLPALGGKIFVGLQSFADRFVDVIYDFFPAGTSRTTVETVSKGAILLVTISFASSVLSFLLNVGGLLLAAYIFTKVFRIDPAGFLTGKDEEPPIPAAAKPARKPRKKRVVKKDMDQGDLTDVWFESKPRKSGRGSRAAD